MSIRLEEVGILNQASPNSVEELPLTVAEGLCTGALAAALGTNEVLNVIRKLARPNRVSSLLKSQIMILQRTVGICATW